MTEKEIELSMDKALDKALKKLPFEIKKNKVCFSCDKVF